jgi:hypothetical protein
VLKNSEAIPAFGDSGTVEDQCDFATPPAWHKCRAERLIINAFGRKNDFDFAAHRLNFTQHGGGAKVQVFANDFQIYVAARVERVDRPNIWQHPSRPD